VPGRAIIIASWIGDGLLACTAIPFVLGVDALEWPAVGVAVILFAASLGIWTWAFVVALTRNAAGDDIVVGSMFGTIGDAPREVRWHLFGALAVCVAIAAATASAFPFAVLVPMLPLGFVGLWAARHGTFPPRRTVPARRS
jgi:hypothetical protein